MNLVSDLSERSPPSMGMAVLGPSPAWPGGAGGRCRHGGWAGEARPTAHAWTPEPSWRMRLQALSWRASCQAW